MITIALRWMNGATAAEAKAAARDLCRRMGWPVHPRGPGTTRSGTAGLAAAATCGAYAIGIDVERIDAAAVDAALMDAVLHPRERRDMPRGDAARWFFSLWTRKEAVLKAAGVGLLVPPNAIAADWMGEEWRLVGVPGGGTIAVRSFAAPEGFAMALAVALDTFGPGAMGTAERPPPGVTFIEGGWTGSAGRNLSVSSGGRGPLE